MIRPSEEQVIAIYKLLVEKTGGTFGLRDEGLLDSALNSAFQTFGGEELYPTLEEKAARLACSLVSNHAFVDGNKRIGVLVMLSYLCVNGIKTICTDDELINFGLSLAAGTLSYEDVLNWIEMHKKITK